MLRMARARLTAKGIVNAGAVQGDALALPFRDGSFDVAVLVAVLGEVPQPERCLQEIRRVLRQDGLLSITEVRGDPDRIRLSSLRAMAERDGYRLRNRPGRGWSYTANFTRQGGQALGDSEGSDGEAAS
jgi:ubiquinone/menaquinone biosynthesis C-methylase UbiE